MKLIAALTFAAFLGFVPIISQAADAPERVLYLSGVHTLDGHLYKPAGKGPFPAVIFNQASQNSAVNQKYPYQTLARMFTSKGWIFFVPGRHQLGPTIEKLDNISGDEKLVREHEKHAANIIGALDWLKSQNFVDVRRIVMVGESAGAVSTLFAGEKNASLCAMVLFAPGTQMLKIDTMKVRMKLAVQNARSPIFLLQTQNDYNLLPIDVLGLELEKKGGMDRFKVYPAYGSLPSHAQKFPSEGYAAWQTDFFAFVNDVLETANVAHKAAN